MDLRIIKGFLIIALVSHVEGLESWGRSAFSKCFLLLSLVPQNVKLLSISITVTYRNFTDLLIG